MPFPSGWPPRPATGVRSIRFYVGGTATTNWSDNAYLFIDLAGANTLQPMPANVPGSIAPTTVGDRNVPGTPMGGGSSPLGVAPGDTLGVQKALIWAATIRIFNDGATDLQISFGAADDGGATSTLIHGVVKPGEEMTYRNRYEAGIALRTTAGTCEFRVEAW